MTSSEVVLLFLAVLFAGFAFAAVTVAVRGWAYSRRFRYSPRRDYAYDFGNPNAGEYEVSLKHNGFFWPATSSQWDTAVLEINLRSTLLGWILDPFIEYCGAARGVKQFFERGCRGRRYLNLVCATPDNIANEDFIHLRGGSLTWRPQRARLKLFKLEISEEDAMLVLAPHPDDAELAAFGLYSRRRSATLTVTQGEIGSRAYLSLPGKASHGTIRGKVRRWESVAVPMLGGVEAPRCANLGYADSSLAGLYARRGSDMTAASSNGAVHCALNGTAGHQTNGASSRGWNGLVDDMVGCLNKVQPRLIVAPHPILDDNADHQLSTLAMLTALDRLGLNQGSILFYVIHIGLTNHYPLGCEGAVLGPPPWFKNDLPPAGGYSFSLADDDAMLKYLALESMSDLRPAVNGVTASWPVLAWWFLRQSYAKLAGIRVPEDSQLARALFQNEWFFVMPFSSAKRLIPVVEHRLNPAAYGGRG